MTFKVGNKVRAIHGMPEHPHNGYVSTMQDFRDKNIILTVQCVDDGGNMSILANNYWWCPEWLELVKDHTPVKQEVQETNPEQQALLPLPEPVTTCSSCGKALPEEDDQYPNSINDDIDCEDCHNDGYCTCEDCDEECLTDDINYLDGIEKYVCDNCKHDYAECSDCGHSYKKDDEGYHCEHCDNDYCGNCSCSCSDDEVCEKKPYGWHYGDPTPELTSLRMVGVEIEAEGFSNRADASGEAPADVGVSEDGSLDNDGLEFQTPPASGTELVRLVKATCKHIDEYGGSVGDHCGLHIHVDARELKHQPTKLSHLLRAYYALEPLLEALIPADRRNGQWCHSLRRDFRLDQLFSSRMRLIEHTWYKTEDDGEISRRKSCKGDGTRYHGLNLHAFLYRGAVELRYHGGTTNPTKILQWCNLNLAIFEWAINHYEEANITEWVNATSPMIGFLHRVAPVLKLSDDAMQYLERRIKKFGGQ